MNHFRNQEKIQKKIHLEKELNPNIIKEEGMKKC